MSEKGQALAEVIAGIAVIGLLSTVLMTLFYTTWSHSNRGMHELAMANELKVGYEVLVSEVQSSAQISVTSSSLTLLNQDNEQIEYLFREGTLYREGISLIEHLDQIFFSLEGDRTLRVRMTFVLKGREFSVPKDLTILRRN